MNNSNSSTTLTTDATPPSTLGNLNAGARRSPVVQRRACFALLASATFLLLGTGHCFALETGSVEVQNNYGEGEITIRLYHADALDQVFGTWRIGGNQTANLQLNGADFAIGGDWIIDIVFGNGVTSKRHLVEKVGTHGNGKWRVVASHIFDGKKS